MKLWSAWVAVTSREETGTSLALFRIAIGLCVAWTLLSVCLTNTLTPLWVDVSEGGIRQTGASSAFVYATLLAGLLGAGGLVLGLGGRMTAACTLIAFKTLAELNDQAGGSYDLLLKNALWLLVLTPSTTTLSLDCRIRRGRWWSRAPVGAWGRYLIAFQLVLMYTSTGWQKLSSYWTPGGDFSALYYILQQPGWQRFDTTWTAYAFPLTQLGTGVSWLWEVTGPMLLVALWMVDTRDRPGRLRHWIVRLRIRDAYVLVGLVMHVALLVLMNVGPFSPISLAYYAALYAPDEWERVGRWTLRERSTGLR